MKFLSGPSGALRIRLSDSFSGVGCQRKHHAAPVLQMNLGHRAVSQEVTPAWNETLQRDDHHSLQPPVYSTAQNFPRKNNRYMYLVALEEFDSVWLLLGMGGLWWDFWCHVLCDFLKIPLSTINTTAH